MATVSHQGDLRSVPAAAHSLDVDNQPTVRACDKLLKLFFAVIFLQSHSGPPLTNLIYMDQ